MFCKVAVDLVSDELRSSELPEVAPTSIAVGRAAESYIPRWLVIYANGLPAREQSPIHVLTGPSVD